MQLQKNKQLSELSTFGIGGIARLFVEVSSIEMMQEALLHCQKNSIPFHLVGRGSNSLFSDEGFDGLVIHNKIATCEYEGTLLKVGAGYNFSLLGAQTARKGLSGLEFASGIPASVGGAIFMNAGANGAEVADVLNEVRFVDEKGELHHFSKEELDFSYRYSSFHQMKGAIVEGAFSLTPLSSARKKQLEILGYRMKTQPYGDKSCGCVFRNPPGKSAGALIDECGLKGKRVGGAEVSTLHANFIVNRDNATAQDILALADQIRECVKEKTGIDLEMELRTVAQNYDKTVSC